MKTFKIFIFTLCTILSIPSYAKLNVITTTTNLKSLVERIGGDQVEVQSFCKGTQDPHYLEAKPSYMLKAAKADLLVSIGLELEVGWLPLIIRGSRNPKIQEGGSGSFVAGSFIETLEKPTGTISRADGDVHPEGNPHFLLDPQNAVIVAEKIKDKLSDMDHEHSKYFLENFKKFSNEINSKLEQWQKQIGKNRKVITYHKTLTYFFHRFGIKNIALLEPKPGIPPSAGHIMEVMKNAKKEGVQLALVENYFDPTVANRVAKDVTGLKVRLIPVSVEGEKDVPDIVQLYEKLVSVMEAK
ncbi:MAG: zinc ABC transporter substrate-binding protein [Halobacteriovoraceae bacterium]|nr:zinc ABC transporter substrate-binding protein [Halobacteriovoraceae bacterium]MCB9095624.1 zinc ABC transporter substrate-binding protein [Halobacteriovoraceae bacterium]